MEALGQADIEAARPMPEDAIFRLYSMTRSITSLAAMILWEEGAFRLDDPVSAVPAPVRGPEGLLRCWVA